MDLKRIEDIERKIKRLREAEARDKEERFLYPTASSHRETFSQHFEPIDLPDEEEEPPTLLPSRYMKHSPVKELEEHSLLEDESEGYQSSQEDQHNLHSDHEDPRETLKKKLDEIRTRKEKLGPPARIIQHAVSSRPDSSKPVSSRPVSSRPVSARPRPSTAKSITSPKPQIKRYIPSTPSYKAPPQPAKLKKSDPVSLFHQRQQEWNKSSFLRANKENNRQGRKLNLNPNQFRKDFEVVKNSSVHDYIKTDYIAPHQKRRDDLRFHTRMKMMEQPY